MLRKLVPEDSLLRSNVLSKALVGEKACFLTFLCLALLSDSLSVVCLMLEQILITYVAGLLLELRQLEKKGQERKHTVRAFP